MGLLEGKTALVTGGMDSVGKAIALRFAAEGARVAVTYDAADPEVLNELETAGCMLRQCCGTDNAQVSATVEALHAECGRIDVVVNNAGRRKFRRFDSTGEVFWDDMIGERLKSAYNFTHAVSAIMARQRGGSLIFMSSAHAPYGYDTQTALAAADAGVIGLAKAMAKEMGGRGIRSNVIAVGLMNSDTEETAARWMSRIAMKRPGTPEEVAGVALFLAGDLSSYVSGQVLSCCGAMVC